MNGDGDILLIIWVKSALAERSLMPNHVTIYVLIDILTLIGELTFVISYNDQILEQIASPNLNYYPNRHRIRMLVENKNIEYTSLSQFSRASFTSSISSPDDEAALNTIQFVQSLMTSSSQAKIKLDLSSYTLLLSTRDIVSSYPQNGIREGIQNAKLLSQAARRCAPAYACSSILAGHTSEGDEYSDIGMWISAEDLNIGIGANGSSAEQEDESCVTTNLEENSRKVLSALGLDPLLSSSSINVSLPLFLIIAIPTMMTIGEIFNFHVHFNFTILILLRSCFPQNFDFYCFYA